MGLHTSLPKCIFTGLPAKNIITEEDCYDYYIEVKGQKIYFKLSFQYEWGNSSLIKENLTLIRGEIFNRNWPTIGLYINENEIKKLITTSSAPKTPKEKLDNLFLEVFKLQETEGEKFMINHHLFDPIF